MPLQNAAVLPHSPILIPEIGKLNYQILKKSAAAYAEIYSDFQGNDIETIIIISPHGQIQADYFTINVGPELKVDLSTFGFLGAGRKFLSDLDLIDNLKKIDTSKIQLNSKGQLDYGTSIPLHLLGDKLPDLKIVALNYASELSLDDHYLLGQNIGAIVKSSAKKIAVIASADLSHRLKKNSPNGYSPKGAKFDNKLMEFLNNPSNLRNNLVNLDPKLIKDAGECGLKSIVTLMGILDEQEYKPEILAYQNDFGIGYLSMNFKL